MGCIICNLHYKIIRLSYYQKKVWTWRIHCFNTCVLLYVWWKYHWLLTYCDICGCWGFLNTLLVCYVGCCLMIDTLNSLPMLSILIFFNWQIFTCYRACDKMANHVQCFFAEITVCRRMRAATLHSLDQLCKSLK